MEAGIDPEVLAGYNAGIERGRLRTGLGLIEFARTQELLMEFLPPPPAVVYDIGGGYGEYSWLLAARGYRVFLYDLSATNIALAAELAKEYPGAALEDARVADARAIGRPDGSADAILLMGPLYHIVEREQRLQALKEARRLLRPGGVLFTGAITRWATVLWAATVFGRSNDLLMEKAFWSMIEEETAHGQHIRPDGSLYRGMGRSFFHEPGEFVRELADAGFTGNDVRGILGPGWLVPDLDSQWQDPARREAVLRMVRLLEREPSLMGLSTHLLAISRKQEKCEV